MFKSQPFVAGVMVPFHIPGDYFLLASLPAGTATVRLYKDGRQLPEDLEQIVSGWDAAPVGGFDRAEITSSVTQQVGFYISRGRVSGRVSTDWYDRNPVHIARNYAASGVAPHGSTQRWTYTVPAGKKAFIEHTVLHAFRNTAAAPVGEVNLAIVVTPAAAAAVEYTIRRFFNNTVGAEIQSEASQGGILLAGDAIEARTSDASTGGSMAYNINAKMTEFDA